jgi:hypothetical protein
LIDETNWQSEWMKAEEGRARCAMLLSRAEVHIDQLKDEVKRLGDAETTSVAITLLMKVLPHLDLRISEHNDGYRLRRDILYFLAGLGYPGYAKVRKEA